MNALIQTLHDISLGLFVNSMYAILSGNHSAPNTVMAIASILGMLGANLFKKESKNGSK